MFCHFACSVILCVLPLYHYRVSSLHCVSLFVLQQDMTDMHDNMTVSGQVVGGGCLFLLKSWEVGASLSLSRGRWVPLYP